MWIFRPLVTLALVVSCSSRATLLPLSRLPSIFLQSAPPHCSSPLSSVFRSHPRRFLLRLPVGPPGFPFGFRSVVFLLPVHRLFRRAFSRPALSLAAAASASRASQPVAGLSFLWHLFFPYFPLSPFHSGRRLRSSISCVLPLTPLLSLVLRLRCSTLRLPRSSRAVVGCRPDNVFWHGCRPVLCSLPLCRTAPAVGGRIHLLLHF